MFAAELAELSNNREIGMRVSIVIERTMRYI